MKKFGVWIFILALCGVMMPACASANSAASLVGPETVRAGDAITLTFFLNGSGIFGTSGTLSYDTNQVTLTDTKQLIKTPWAVEFNGNHFVAYDNNLTNPINGKAALFSVTFKVKSVAAGTAFHISCSDVKTSDGSADVSVGTVTYSNSISAPLSADNDLATLTVGNATFSPAFSAENSNYTANVPFEISKLDVIAIAADEKATVSVNNPDLIPDGTTKVTVTVTAENGAKKTYTFSVNRAKDPNYVASNNNALAAITVEGFLLSPVFAAENPNYVIWVPYETESVKIAGVSADEKATVTVDGGETLAVGQDNPVRLVCTAENGDKRVYTVIVKRAAAHDGSTDRLPSSASSDAQLPVTDLVSDSNGAATQLPSAESPKLAWWWLVVVGIVGLALGYAAAYLIFKTRKESVSD